MTQYEEHIFDIATNKTTIIPESKETIAEFIKEQKANELLLAEITKAAEAKTAAKAKLEALGLTTDDLKALGL
jgi:putative N-acetylmannosamine-6-phosphate epimerase